MKKILIFIFLCLSLNSIAAAEPEEVHLDFNNNFKKHTINNTIKNPNTYNDDTNYDDDDSIFDEMLPIETPVPVDVMPPTDTFNNSNYVNPQMRLYNGLFQGATKLYNLQIADTSIPSSLFQEQLTKYFESGPLKSLHTWGVVQSNLGVTMPDEGSSSTNFDVSLVNVLFDGQFRSGKENFRLMLDPTHQHNRPFMQQFIQDAYVTTNRIPHHTLLIGHSRPGVGLEGAQSPYTLPFINRSQISRNFAAIRKTGVRLKGDYSLVDYDLGGYSSDTFFTEFMPGVEFDGWVNIKPFGKTDGRYGKLVTGGGIVAGNRNSTDYFVSGAYIGYRYKKFWTRMEYSVADGSNGGSGLTDKKRQGWYITLGYFVTKKLELLARYDVFDHDRTASSNIQREYSAGMNYYIKGQALKLIMNYIFCQSDFKPNSHRILIGAQLAI